MQGMITQSNYFPWRGFFAALRKVDVLVLYDSQQYTRRSWRNRNLILNNSDQEWLTLSVRNSGNYLAPINKMKISSSQEINNHLNILSDRYSKYKNTEGFHFIKTTLENCKDFDLLSKINLFTLQCISEYLEININIFLDDYSNHKADKNLKLIDVCKKFSISKYYTGPTALNYLDLELFKKSNISVNVFKYETLNKSGLMFEPSIIHWIITLPRNEIFELTRFNS